MLKKVSAFSVEYSLVSSTALKANLLPRYAFSREATIVLIHQGFHDTYLITSAGIRYVLRIYKSGWKTYEQVGAELSLLLMLKEAGFSVSGPLADQHNDLIQKIEAPEGERYAVVFTYAPGKAVASLTADHAILFGKHLAAMHLVTANKRIVHLNREYTVDNILEFAIASVQLVIPGHDHAVNKLVMICDELRKRLSTAVISDCKWGICHGDPHHENIFVDPVTKSMALFDFDFAGNGLLLYDLGSFCFYERNNPDHIVCFLEGYEQITPLSETERALLTEFKLLMMLFHLGARSRNADGIRNPIWFPEAIAIKIDEIEKEMNRPMPVSREGNVIIDK